MQFLNNVELERIQSFIELISNDGFPSNVDEIQRRKSEESCKIEKIYVRNELQLIFEI